MYAVYREIEGKTELLLDSAADVATLPTNFRVGSLAYVITTDDMYILNASRQWVKMFNTQS